MIFYCPLAEICRCSKKRQFLCYTPLPISTLLYL